MLHQVGDLFELNVKLQCQKVNVFERYCFNCSGYMALYEMIIRWNVLFNRRFQFEIGTSLFNLITLQQFIMFWKKGEFQMFILKKTYTFIHSSAFQRTPFHSFGAWSWVKNIFPCWQLIWWATQWVVHVSSFVKI